MQNTVIAAPISKHKDYILKQWVAYIIEHYINDVHSVLLVDNTTNDKEYHKQIRKLIPECYREKFIVVYEPGNAKMHITEKLLLSQQYIQRYCIERNLNLFFIECDIFPPKDLTQRFNSIVAMKQLRNSIIGCIYFTGSKEGSFVPFVRTGIVGNFKIMNIFSPDDFFLKITGNIERIDTVSFGCTFIPLSILKAIPFRLGKQDRLAFSDTFYFEDCIINKVPCYVHSGIICKHVNQSWSQYV
ncbi:MAG: hypothetical protein WC389_12345 [Lutibacter sp.]|jgi:hypothetical protein